MRTHAASHTRTALLLTGLLALSACDAPVSVGGGSGGGDGGSGGSDTGSGGSGGADTGTGNGGSGGGGACAPDTLDQAMADFIDCMSYTDWVDTGMPEIGNTQTLNGNVCHSCHASGVGGFVFGDPSTPAMVMETFTWYTQMFTVHYIVSGMVDDATCAVTLFPSQEIANKGLSGGPHPAYDFTAGQAALMAFVDVTYDKMLNGSCAP